MNLARGTVKVAASACSVVPSSTANRGIEFQTD
jgi:hypothetical protein